MELHVKLKKFPSIQLDVLNLKNNTNLRTKFLNMDNLRNINFRELNSEIELKKYIF